MSAPLPGSNGSTGSWWRNTMGSSIFSSSVPKAIQQLMESPTFPGNIRYAINIVKGGSKLPGQKQTEYSLMLNQIIKNIVSAKENETKALMIMLEGADGIHPNIQADATYKNGRVSHLIYSGEDGLTPGEYAVKYNNLPVLRKVFELCGTPEEKGHCLRDILNFIVADPLMVDTNLNDQILEELLSEIQKIKEKGITELKGASNDKEFDVLKQFSNYVSSQKPGVSSPAPEAAGGAGTGLTGGRRRRSTRRNRKSSRKLRR